MKNARTMILFLAAFCITASISTAQQIDANCQPDKDWQTAFKFPAEKGEKEQMAVFSYELLTDARYVVPDHAEWVAKLYVSLAASEVDGNKVLDGKVLRELTLLRDTCTGEAKINMLPAEQDLSDQPQPNALAYSATGYGNQTQGRGPSFKQEAVSLGTQTGLSFVTLGPVGVVWSLITGAPRLIQVGIHKLAGRGSKNSKPRIYSEVSYDAHQRESGNIKLEHDWYQNPSW